jgi:hypothetical protein
MTISERRASTVFNRFNFTIMDVIDVSDATPTDYEPEDFFLFYEIIFQVNETEPNAYSTVQYLFLTSVVSFLRDEYDAQEGNGGGSRLARLQEFLTVPIVVFNNVVYPGGPIPDNMGKTVTMATSSYRVCPILFMADDNFS